MDKKMLTFLCLLVSVVRLEAQSAKTIFVPIGVSRIGRGEWNNLQKKNAQTTSKDRTLEIPFRETSMQS